jgi:hypothetical protein
MILFKGEAKKFSITVKDGAGATVDPSTLGNVKIWLYDRKSETVFAQWSITAEDDFEEATINVNAVEFYLSSTQSAAAAVGDCIIQVSIYDSYPSADDLICTKKGLFAIVKNAKV